MFIHYRTLGLVLKKENRGENDQLFTFYTKDFGKFEILGKSIRKISSKLRAGTDIFYLSEIEFIQGKSHKTLTDSLLIDKFESLRKDLKRLAVAYKISETFNDLVRGEERDRSIWNLLLVCFKKLNTSSIFKENYLLIYYFFVWNFFAITGYLPEIHTCSVCQKKLYPGKLYFVPEEGGVVCSSCYVRNENFKIVNEDFIKILRIITKKDWLTLEKIKFDKEQNKLLKDVSDFYLSFILEHN